MSSGPEKRRKRRPGQESSLPPKAGGKNRKRPRGSGSRSSADSRTSKKKKTSSSSSDNNKLTIVLIVVGGLCGLGIVGGGIVMLFSGGDDGAAGDTEQVASSDVEAGPDGDAGGKQDRAPKPPKFPDLPGVYYVQLLTEYRTEAGAGAMIKMESVEPRIEVLHTDGQWTVRVGTFEWSGTEEEIDKLDLDVPFAELGDEFRSVPHYEELSTSQLKITRSGQLPRATLSGYQKHVPRQRVTSQGAFIEGREGFQTVDLQVYKPTFRHPGVVPLKTNFSLGRAKQLLLGHAHRLTSVLKLGDSGHIASACQGGEVRVWDVSTGEETQKFENGGVQLLSLAASPDGRLLAAGRADGAIDLLEVADGTTKQTIKAHDGFVTCVAFTPDGKSIVSGGQDRALKMWNIETGGAIRDFEGLAMSAMALAVSADGSTIYSGGNDEAVSEWDAATGERRRLLRGHTNAITDLSLSGDGTKLASSSLDSTIRVWSVESGWLLAECIGHASGSPQVVKPGDDEERRVYLDSSLARIHPKVAGVMAVDFLPSGRQLASVGADTTVRVWDLTSTMQSFSAIRAHEGRVQDVVVLNDGPTVVSAGFDKTLRFWDVGSLPEPGPDLADVGEAPIGDQDGQVVACLGHRSRVHALLPIDDGRKLMSVGEDGTVRTWDVDTGMMTDKFRASEMSGSGNLARSANGDVLYTAGGRGKGGIVVRQWKINASGNLEVVAGPDFEIPPPGDIYYQAGTDPSIIRKMIDDANNGHFPSGLAVSPSGQWLAVCMADVGTQIFNTATGQRIGETDDSRPKTNSRNQTAAVNHTPAFISDDEFVAYGIHRTAPDWTVSGFTQALTTANQTRLFGNRSSVSSGVLIPGMQKMLLAGGQTIFEVPLAATKNIEPAADPLSSLDEFVGHGARVTCVAAADSERFVSGDESGAVHVWNRSTREVEAVFKSRAPIVKVLALSDTDVISADASGAIRRWDTRRANAANQIARFETIPADDVGIIARLHPGKVEGELIAIPARGAGVLVNLTDRSVTSDDLKLPVAWSDDFQVGLAGNDLVNLRSGKIGKSLEDEEKDVSNGRVECASFAGDHVFVGRDTGRIDRHNARSGKFELANKDGDSEPVFVQANAEHGVVLTEDERRVLRILDYETLAERSRIDLRTPIDVTRAVWCPGQPIFAVSDTGGIRGTGGVTVVNSETGETVFSTNAEISGTFTADGRQLITAGYDYRQSGIVFRNVGTWEVTREITVYPEINDLQLTHDGSMLVAAPKSGGLAILKLVDSP